jgi:HD-GYP domain-containing protein (c-di-GMP phosphodiesterase class II)
MLTTTRKNLLQLRQTSLYVPAAAGGYILFKPSGVTLRAIGLKPEEIPANIFIMPEDRLMALREIRTMLSRKLRESVAEGVTDGLHAILCELLDLTFSDPSQENIETLSEVTGLLAEQSDKKDEDLRDLVTSSNANYNTVVHSVNVMALTMYYAIHHKLPRQQCQELGLAALLHDIGKVNLNNEILNAPRRLTDAEFEEFRRHPLDGYRLLSKRRFRSRAVALAAIQHHEKLDGSGYPMGIADISFVGRLIAIIDSYESITASDRPYRSAVKPFTALSRIRDEMSDKKFDRAIFERFLASLA